MADKLSAQQRSELKAKLQGQLNAVQEKVRQELRESSNQHYIDLAGKVHDLEEESLADLLVDINLAITDLHIEEIRDIERALIRFSQGTYGTCIDCGMDIDYKRLYAYPAAKRCLSCQTRYERAYTKKDYPSL